jgi:GNAT superfamily N-acetyltransferase
MPGARPRTTRDLTDRSVRIRPLADGETGPVLAVFEGLGARSRELRFMSPKFRLTATDLGHLTHVDRVDRVALVAELPDGRPIGIARFVRHAGDSTAADVAVAVVDSWQRRGIGARLAQALGAWARGVGVRRFTIDMMRDNHGAVRLMRHAGGTVRPVGLDDHSAEFELTLTYRSAVENQVDVGNLAPLP